MNNFLKEILQHKRREIAAQKRRRSPEQLREQIREAPAPRSLRKALRREAPPAIIAELKKASPSAGVIRRDFEPESLAVEYREGGAAALSVLTDQRYFQGQLEFITRIRPLVDLPILRKDFVFDPYQILEARAAGADAVLLIAAALPPVRLGELLAAARENQLEALVEVHSAAELDTALSAGAILVGINNRDLTSFNIDLGVTERLAARVPETATLVGESGIHSVADVRRMITAGVHALLIGTYFMKQPRPGKALAEFRKEIAACCG